MNIKLMNACSGPPEEPEKIKLKKKKKKPKKLEGWDEQ